MELTLESLGLSQEEIIERIVDRVATRLLKTYSVSEYGDEYETPSVLAQKLNKTIQDRLDKKIAEFCEEVIVPNLNEKINTITLQRTNLWGEKAGDAMTFREYLIHRAENFLTEAVNYEGKAKWERKDKSYWTSDNKTRLTYMIDKYLDHAISTSLKDAVKIVNDNLAKSITETVKMQLDNIKEKLKVDVKLK